MRYASYLSPEWGHWAQYCRAQAGYYPNFPRRLRRELEIAAHQAGVRQVPRLLAWYRSHEIAEMLVEASQ